MRNKLTIALFLLVPFLGHSQVLTNVASGQIISAGTNVSNVIAAGGGGGSPALVFTNAALGTPGGCITPASSSTGSSLIVVGMRGYRDPYPLASSSPANSWNTNLVGLGAGGAAARLEYTNNPVTSGSQTFSADGGDVGTEYSGIGAVGFSGVTGVLEGVVSNSVTSRTIQPGSFTPTTPHDVCVIVLGADVGTWVWGIDSGFTIFAQGQTSTGRSFAIAQKIKTDSLPENPTFTATSGSGTPTVSVQMGMWK